MVYAIEMVLLRMSLLGLISRLHVFWYRLTIGRLGDRVHGSPVLLLSTIGRRSGKERTIPVLYMEDGGKLVVVASNGGRDTNPSWFKNAWSNPLVQVQVKGSKRSMRVEIAGTEEKARLWLRLVAMYPEYEQYQRRTERAIPVVILHPVEETLQDWTRRASAFC